MAKELRRIVQYDQLVKTLRQEIQNTKMIVERQLVLTYWNMGQRIALYLGEAPPHGALAALARRLAKDVDICQRTLEHCHQFFTMYPRLNPRLPITWSHYRHLITVENKKQRELLARRIVKDGLNTLEFKALLHQRSAKIHHHARLKDVVRGLLYHYRVIKAASDEQQARGFMIDCGFANSVVPPAAAFKLVNKRIISSRKTKGGYRIVSTNAPKERIYTYKAVLERIIDADTFLVNVDCGFGVWTRQRLRLRGIDAPERRTTPGIKALQWVTKRLKNCPLVVVKTHKSDKYDRYLVDLFYLPKESDPATIAASGQYLNQEMLDKGLATVWVA